MANATVAGVTETATYGETSSSTFVDQQWAGAMLVAPKTSGSVGIVNKFMVGCTWRFRRRIAITTSDKLASLPPGTSLCASPGSNSVFHAGRVGADANPIVAP